MHKSGLVELEAVLAVARHLNFRSAAAELEISPSALSNAIIGLEERLGVRLFNRTTRSVALTEAGEHFVDRVAPAFFQIRSAMEIAATRSERPSGTLRINSSVSAARLIMAPVIAEYLRRFPEMDVTITTEPRLIDIVADGADAGVRLAGAVPRDMVSVRLGPPVRFVVVGSPGYLLANGTPETPGDLLKHTCIRARMPSGTRYPWEFARAGETVTIDVPGRLTLDDPTVMLEAARAGVGLAYVADFHLSRDAATGTLVEVLSPWAFTVPGLCLYYPGRRHVPAGLKALANLIRETVGRASDDS